MTDGEWNKVEISSWLVQTLVFILLGVSGYFISGDLSDIKEELRLSRVERAQLRADMSALEIGLRGDRFTQSDWQRERDRITKEIEEVQKRLRELERE